MLTDPFFGFELNGLVLLGGALAILTIVCYYYIHIRGSSEETPPQKTN